ncbi:hypothetical protein pb186bvf_006727 [Paramecium bursaria]
MFTKSPHMDLIFKKISQQRERKNGTPNDRTSPNDFFSRPVSNQTSNKDLLNLTSFQKQKQDSAKLNKSCNYHSSQINQRMQSTKADIKKKLLNEILRGSHSHASTSYLITTMKEKSGKRAQTNKYNTTEDGSSFTMVQNNSAQFKESPLRNQDIKLLQQNLNEEMFSMRDELNHVHGFYELLERMQKKEQKYNIQIFATLKHVFQSVQSQIQSVLNSQQRELDTLCKQNVLLKQQILEQSMSMNKLKQLIQTQQKQINNKNDEQVINIMNTLRSGTKVMKKQQDTQDTCKLKQEQEFQDDFRKYSSDDSIPFIDPSTMLVPLEKKGLSLNLNPLKDPLKAPMGYQDEFMSNINEFSESWRQQALAEKRF